METVVVERAFTEPMGRELHAKLVEEKAWCLEQYNVTYLRTYFSRDRKRTICTYRAPDAESVRRACDLAELPYERVWSCEIIDNP